MPDEQQIDPEMAGKSLQPIGHFMLQQRDIPVRLHSLEHGHAHRRRTLQ